MKKWGEFVILALGLFMINLLALSWIVRTYLRQFPDLFQNFVQFIMFFLLLAFFLKPKVKGKKES